jgi:hypothetical protein
VNDYALLPGNLPPVLARMNLGLHCGTVARGAIRWWQPEYLSGPNAAAVRASFPARDAAIRDACIAEFIGQRRAVVAPINRALRDAQVYLFALPDDQRILALCSYAGEWRTCDGANRGRDLIDLGMWRWSCRFGQAAHRIARVLGWSSIPLVSEAA